MSGQREIQDTRDHKKKEKVQSKKTQQKAERYRNVYFLCYNTPFYTNLICQNNYK